LEENLDEDFILMKGEVVIGTFDNAEGLCDQLEQQVEEWMSKVSVEGSNMGEFIMPKFHHKDGKIICGLQLPFPKEIFEKVFRNPAVGGLKVPYDI